MTRRHLVLALQSRAADRKDATVSFKQLRVWSVWKLVARGTIFKHGLRSVWPCQALPVSPMGGGFRKRDKAPCSLLGDNKSSSCAPSWSSLGCSLRWALHCEWGKGGGYLANALRHMRFMQPTQWRSFRFAAGLQSLTLIFSISAQVPHGMGKPTSSELRGRRWHPSLALPVGGGAAFTHALRAEEQVLSIFHHSEPGFSEGRVWVTEMVWVQGLLEGRPNKPISLTSVRDQQTLLCQQPDSKYFGFCSNSPATMLW